MKWVQSDKTQSRELQELLTASVHNTTQNSSDNLPSYLQTHIKAQILSIGVQGAMNYMTGPSNLHKYGQLLFHRRWTVSLELSACRIT